MKLEPLFDLQDVLNGGDEMTVAYLFETERETSDIPEETDAVVEITEASDTPAGNQILDQVNLPFGIGDVFYLQEPFRICAWNLYNSMFSFEYKDGTVGRPVKISNQDIIDYLIGDTDLMEGNYNNTARISPEQKEIERICRWHPSYDMPREAIRVTKIVKEVSPVRISDMTKEQMKNIGYLEKKEMMERIHTIKPEANDNNWILLVGLGELAMPKVDLWR